MIKLILVLIHLLFCKCYDLWVKSANGPTGSSIDQLAMVFNYFTKLYIDSGSMPTNGTNNRPIM